MPTIYMATTGNDANGGADPVTDAKATLSGASGAISAASDGDTIEVVAGSYNAQNYLTAALASGKSLTIKPYNGGSVTFTASGTWWPILTEAAAMTGVFEFQDITFTLGTSSRGQPIYNIGGKSLSFTRCTIVGGAANCLLLGNGVGSNTRQTILTDCTLDATTSTVTPIACAGLAGDSITVSGGSITGEIASSHTAFAIGGATNATLTGCTISGCQRVYYNYTGTAASAGVIKVISNTVTELTNEFAYLSGTLTSVLVLDNAVAGDDTATPVFFRDDGITVASITIEGNTATGLDDGIYVASKSDVEVINNTLTITKDIGAGSGYALSNGPDDWPTVAPDTTDLGVLASRCKIVGNTVTITGTGARHAAFLSMQYAGVVFANNKIICTDRTTSDYGVVCKAQGAMILDNVIHSNNRGLYLAGAVGCLVANNVVVADAGYGISFDDAGRNPDGNLLINNAIATPTGTPSVSYDSSIASPLGNRFEHNMYKTEEITFNGTAYTALATLQASEAAYKCNGGGAMHETDIFADPAIDTAGGTYRVGNGRAYVNGWPVNGWANQIGPFQGKKKNVAGLLLPI